MAPEPILTWTIVLAVARRGNEFLLVHEHDGWFLPAGRAEIGEDLAEAARRETLEEAGVPVVITGVIRVEHTPARERPARLRVIFAAEADGDCSPKSTPDEHTLEARWVALERIVGLPLRSPDVLPICEHLARGGHVYPLSVLTSERAPFPAPSPRCGDEPRAIGPTPGTSEER
jgi:ADP-ribose pyrophosphatase YjhB (NUDIX family)